MRTILAFAAVTGLPADCLLIFKTRLERLWTDPEARSRVVELFHRSSGSFCDRNDRNTYDGNSAAAGYVWYVA